MKHLALMAALLASAAAMTPPVHAQTPPALTYAQPLTPQAVRQVQSRLRELGVYNGNVDGVWGPDSQTALERYQQSRGLQVTGQLNQATLATMNLNPGDLLAMGERAPVNQEQIAGQALRPDAIRMIQGRLRQLGFYSGPADGVWGPNTEQAYQRFQQSRGLQASSQINSNTLTTMGLDPNSVLAGAPIVRSGSSTVR